MPAIRAFYTVLQYLPDPARAEAANTGVALYVPATGQIVVRTSPTLKRVKKFFSPDAVDLRRIELGVESLKGRLTLNPGEFSNEAELVQFAAARADAVRITAPRLIKIDDLAHDLDALYEELVGDPDLKTQAIKPGRNLPPRLAEVIARLKADGRAWKPKLISVPTTGRSFHIAAAYRNGVVNYVRPESLASRARAEKRLPELGFNGRLIARHPIDNELGKLIVVSSDPAADPGTEAEYKNALADFEVVFIPHAKVDEYAAEVEKEAH